MTLMTAVFDNLIIGFGIVDYDESKILGLKILLAPIEDFAYTLAAVLMVPAIWNALRSRM
jgi:lycopene cyclase domain-containing protein